MIAGSVNPFRPQGRIASIPITLALLLLTVFSVQAATLTWDGSADTLWSTGANWSGNVAPTTGDGIEFPPGASRLSNYNDLTGITFQTVNFQTGGYRIKGEPLTFGSGGFLFASYGSGADTIDLALNGPGGVVMSANGGTLVLRGASGFTGETSIAFGATLVVTHDSALGATSGATVVNVGGTLALQGGISIRGEHVEIRGVGTGSLGALRSLSGVNTVAGEIKLSNNATIGTLADTLYLTDTIVRQSALALTFTGAGVTNVPGLISGLFSSVTKSGTGTLILGGNNTYASATLIQEGTVKLGTGSNVYTSGPLGTYEGRVTVASGAVLDLNGYTLGVNYGKLMTLNGAGLTALPAGALTNTGTNASSLASITLGADATITTTTAGSLNLGAIFETSYTLNLDGASGSVGTISGNFNSTTGGLTKSGAGAWTLVGTTTVGGALTLDAGTLVGSADQPFTVKGNWTGAGAFAHNGGTVTLGGTSAQSIGNASVFNNLTIDNSAGVELLSALRVDGVLTLANGKVTTSSSVLSVGKSGSVANANTSRFIEGNLRRYIPAATNASFTFPIGASTSYRPVTIAFTGTTADNGFLTATTSLDTAGSGASGLDSTADVRGRWTFSDSALGGFTSYAATLNWPSADVDIGANTAAFLARNFVGGIWTNSSVDSRTATSIRATGLTGFGTLKAGIVLLAPPTTLSYTEHSALYTLGEGITANRAATTGGNESLIFAVHAGALPAGLSINTSTGMLWGTPVSLGDFSYTIRVRNNGGFVDAALTATVRDALPAITYPVDTVDYVLRSPIETVTPTNMGGVVRSWAIAPNLASVTGLAFNTTTGRISGTPVYLSAPTQYVVTATGFGMNADHDTLVISTSTPAPTVSYSHEPQQFEIGTPVDFAKSAASGIIQSYAVNPALPAGLLFNATTGRIVGTPTAVASLADYVITVTGPGGTGNDTVHIAVTTPAPTVSYADADQELQLGVPVDFPKSGASGRIASYGIDPALPLGLLINPTTGRIVGAPTVVASLADYVITVTGPGGTGSDTVHIAVTTPAPTVSYADGPQEFQLRVLVDFPKSGASGRIASYAVDPALPWGLLINPTTGRIVGTPTAVASLADYVITATGPGGTGSDTVHLAVTVNPPSIAFAFDSVTFVRSNAEITAFRPTNTGGQITGWSITPGSNGQSLTANTGLQFNPTTGRILGKPVYVSPWVTYTVIANGLAGSADSAVIILETTTPLAKRGVGDGSASTFRVTGSMSGYMLRLPLLDADIGSVSLSIRDLSGRMVWSRTLDAATQISPGLVWDGRDQSGRLVPAGMYMVRIGVLREDGSKTAVVSDGMMTLDP